MEKLCIVAGDSGVYVGLVEGGAAALTAAGIVTLTRSRHLRRYYVAGRTGSAQGGGTPDCATRSIAWSGGESVSDLAVRGLDPSSPSVSSVLTTPAALAGVRRVLEVRPEVAASFGVQP